MDWQVESKEGFYFIKIGNPDNICTGERKQIQILEEKCSKISHVQSPEGLPL